MLRSDSTGILHNTYLFYLISCVHDTYCGYCLVASCRDSLLSELDSISRATSSYTLSEMTDIFADGARGTYVRTYACAITRHRQF